MGLYITIGREKKVRRGREGRGKGKGSRMEGRVAPSNWEAWIWQWRRARGTKNGKERSLS